MVSEAVAFLLDGGLQHHQLLIFPKPEGNNGIGRRHEAVETARDRLMVRYFMKRGA